MTSDPSTPNNNLEALEAAYDAAFKSGDPARITDALMALWSAESAEEDEVES